MNRILAKYSMTERQQAIEYLQGEIAIRETGIFKTYSTTLVVILFALAAWLMFSKSNTNIEYMVIVAICVIYVLLGTAMEELSMILLTVPVFFPLIVHLGLDPVWFGILIVVVVEIGLISPPVGMNLFVLNALLPHVPTKTLFQGVLPFVVADVVRLGILVAFPIISLWLPSLMR